ncbi:efflux RND transporter periplasmic adaptor subunit [Clostridium sp. DSM 100503]|uniref:efflux RND transporter periplasmic adaptor subunit n=1 Tax=Clostridium sp. DSM 100503 TaxID=2963282 RepID=UPI00214A015C|nr:efflux RND transporter periplasmic adaptor subunit [Clostridium sp. DSM 100503]MCR1950842.1 efflux RND transporter periplasmic adaptor subunit [Clostridium sp. DSM 100503]
MKKKQIIIGISIFTLALIATVSGALYVKNKSTVDSNKENKVDYFEIEEAGGLKFKGSSIISNEQKIILDKSNGEINEVFVEDGQIVEKDTVLFNYYNESIQEQVDELNRQISSLSSKIDREKERISKLEALKKEVQASAQITNQAEQNLNQGVNIQGEQVENASVLEELNANLNDVISKRDALKEKVVKSVKSEITGKVYINNEDPTKEYMRVISEDSLIASEFDIEELKIDDKVEMKIISNNKKVTGKITKIEEIPSMSTDQKSMVYKFYVKPDESIKIGFSVELTVNPGEIVIPKSCVIEEEGKLYVKLVEGENNKKVEISATLKDDNYIIQNDTLKVGDKILLNPSEDSKEEV